MKNSKGKVLVVGILFALIIAGCAGPAVLSNENGGENGNSEPASLGDNGNAAIVNADSIDKNSNSDDELEFTGFVEQINDPVWVISGAEFVFDANTEFNGSFAIGDQVKVHFSISEEGTFVVREIEFSEFGDDADNGNDNGNSNANDNGNINDNSNSNGDDNGNDNDNSNGGDDDNGNDNSNDDDNGNDNSNDNDNDNDNDSSGSGNDNGNDNDD